MNKTAPGAATPGTAIGATNFVGLLPLHSIRFRREINAKKEQYASSTGGRHHP